MTTAILAGRFAGRLLKSCINAYTPPADAPMTITSRGMRSGLIMANQHANHLPPGRDPEMLSLRSLFECEPLGTNLLESRGQSFRSRSQSILIDVRQQQFIQHLHMLEQ
jgi:hypothetical protein